MSSACVLSKFLRFKKFRKGQGSLWLWFHFEGDPPNFTMSNEENTLAFVFVRSLGHSLQKCSLHAPTQQVHAVVKTFQPRPVVEWPLDFANMCTF